jgi:tetratricopeptide (TPR) repeat protein
LRDWHRQSEYQRVIDAVDKLAGSANPEQRLLQALALVMAGDSSRGLPLLQQARLTTPDNHDWASDRALADLIAGDPEAASATLGRLVAEANATAVDLARLAAVRLGQEQLDAAAALYREATQREPGRPHWHSNLAAVLVRLQRWEEALEEFEVALRLSPDLEQAQAGRRDLLLALERGDEIVDELEQSLASDPEDAHRRLQLARALFRQNRFTDALRCLRDGLESAEALLDQREADGYQHRVATQTQLRTALADIWTQRGAHRRALAALESARGLQETPRLDLDCRAVSCLLEMRRYDEAERRLDRLCEDNAAALPVALLRAQCLSEQEQHREAEQLLKELLATYPGHAGLLCQLGQSLLWTGRLDEAADCFLQASRIQPMALAQLTRTRRFPEDEASLARMAGVATNPLIPDSARASMGFALAEAYDRLGRIDDAARCLLEANRLSARQINYQPQRFHTYVNRTMRVFDERLFRAQTPIRDANRKVVLVVGMPRSGTTLVEQILSAHPDVYGAGELDLLPNLGRLMPRVLHSEHPYPECARELTATLREEAARHLLYGLALHDQDHPVIVDKLPHNFVNLGLVASVLPGARIVCVSRDPRDVGLSNFQQNFKARMGGMGYAFDLAHIAAQLNDHHRLMQHWRRVLPTRLYELRYEDLVRDQAGQTRRLLDYLELDWDDAVLRFDTVDRPVRTASVAQVRETIYASACGKWRRYESMLAPMLEALEASTLSDYRDS